MEREGITIIAQLLSAMKDSVSELDSAMKSKDLERIARAKREILNIKDQIDRVI